jgi:DNA-binding GntR family transcriptional regulator
LQHGLPSASTVQKAARTLETEELIAKRPDRATAIVEPFLAEWIERYAV